MACNHTYGKRYWGIWAANNVLHISLAWLYWNICRWTVIDSFCCCVRLHLYIWYYTKDLGCLSSSYYTRNLHLYLRKTCTFWQHCNRKGVNYNYCLSIFLSWYNKITINNFSENQWIIEEDYLHKNKVFKLSQISLEIL